MLKKAKHVEFVLTPSDRDALVLENKLIKHHSPPYNVMLKDDETYPFICATIGDALPQFVITPRRQEGQKASKYRYFGPYPNFCELNQILQGVEEKYDLRNKSFQAKFGSSLTKSEYQEHFQRALKEVFEGEEENDGESLFSMRSKYEEASKLFESEYNVSRDVVAVGRSDDGSTTLIFVLQLREGMINGQFSYSCDDASPAGLSEEDLGDLIQAVLQQRHYSSGGSSTHNGRFSFFPKEILLQYAVPDPMDLKDTIHVYRKMAEPDPTRKTQAFRLRTPAKSGGRKETDNRALQLAVDNAVQIANDKALVNMNNAPKSSVDGTAIEELAALLSLDKSPRRIECYDISHTQGENAVGSRVVFIDGKPANHLYRTFNIRSVTGPDDYASLEEVLHRRFARVWGNVGNELVDQDDPWSLPDLVVIDGGKGQLSAALKGMAKANVFPKDASVIMPEEEDESDCFLIAEEMHPSRNVGVYAQVPVIALAKREEQVFTTWSIDPVNNSADSAAMLLLRALRDESHRRALTSHRIRRKKALMKNS
jgi:excinuclease ABC subunit C